MKRVEFGICGLDVTVPREALKDLFQAGRRKVLLLDVAGF
jgi:hypothetical protein